MYIRGLLAALVVLAEGLHAQVPRAEATLDTAAARVGDPIRLTLTLHHDATARPEAPDLSQILRDFAPRCAGWNQREVATGFELAQECELRLYELGLHEVPAVAVPFVTAAGDTLLRATQPLAIEVISARSEGEDQPRDIKPPVIVSRRGAVVGGRSNRTAGVGALRARRRLALASSHPHPGASAPARADRLRG